MKITKSRVPKRLRAGEATPAAAAGRAGGWGRQGRGRGSGEGGRHRSQSHRRGCSHGRSPKQPLPRAKKSRLVPDSRTPAPEAPSPRGAGQPGHIPDPRRSTERAFPSRARGLTVPSRKGWEVLGAVGSRPRPGKVVCRSLVSTGCCCRSAPRPSAPTSPVTGAPRRLHRGPWV